MIPPAHNLDLERDLERTYTDEALHTPSSLLASVLRVANHWKRLAQGETRDEKEAACAKAMSHG